ncbi:hypoxia induced protein conserved region-domain-containing protein, partial [Vararia minispora EC-137]
ESYRERMIRKIKTEPLVPLGAAATTAALLIAVTKLRKGDSRSLNTWLRVRVIAQGLTVVAICAGSATFVTHKPPTPEQLAAKAEERHAKERVEFEERMRAAERAEAAE